MSDTRTPQEGLELTAAETAALGLFRRAWKLGISEGAADDYGFFRAAFEHPALYAIFEAVLDRVESTVLQGRAA